jgi:hypothetical protein
MMMVLAARYPSQICDFGQGLFRRIKDNERIVDDLVQTEALMVSAALWFLALSIAFLDKLAGLPFAFPALGLGQVFRFLCIDCITRVPAARVAMTYSLLPFFVRKSRSGKAVVMGWGSARMPEDLRRCPACSIALHSEKSTSRTRP